MLLIKPYIKVELILFKRRRSKSVGGHILLEWTSKIKIDIDLIYFTVIGIIQLVIISFIQ